MPTAVSSAFGAGVTGLSTDITDLLASNLPAILTVAGILIAVTLVWRFTRRVVR